QGDDQDSSSATAVGKRTDEEGSDDVPEQIQQDGQTKIAGRVHRRAAWDNLRTGLDERDVDVKDVIERKKKTDANDGNEEIGKGPGWNAVLASDDVSAFTTLFR